MVKNSTPASRKTNLKESVPEQPTLEDIQYELAMKFGSIGVLLSEMFRPGVGAQLFGLPPNTSLSGIADSIDVTTTTIGRQLPIFYDYAYNGRLLKGHEKIVDPFDSNAAELLRDFVEVFGDTTGYTELSEMVATEGCSDFRSGGLSDLVERMIARNYLDKEYSLSLAQLALLTGMNERSVRNAASAGKNQLTLNSSGEVDFHIAIQWLTERSGRGFTPTLKVGFPEEGKESDTELDAIGIPAFIRHRLLLRFGKKSHDEHEIYTVIAPEFAIYAAGIPEIIDEAASIAKLNANEVISSMQYPLAIPPHHCAGLAKMIGVDPAWFTLQVMRALYPEEMDMVLNPVHYQHTVFSPSIVSKPLAAIEIVLTTSMIRHGYLDMPAIAKAMFPEDCFTVHSGDERGATVMIRYSADQLTETDIRVKSEKTISPRKRFTAWLQTELSAQPGDRVRIERKAAREYRLSFQPAYPSRE